MYTLSTAGKATREVRTTILRALKSAQGLRIPPNSIERFFRWRENSSQRPLADADKRPEMLQLFEQSFQATGDTFSVPVVGARGDADRWRAPDFAAVNGSLTEQVSIFLDERNVIAGLPLIAALRLRIAGVRKLEASNAGTMTSDRKIDRCS